MELTFDTIKNETLLGLVAMVLIFALEMYAMSLGIDGTALALAAGAIAGVGGFDIARRKWKPKESE